MSLQIKTNQFLYNIIELTSRKKYSRVIRICEFLESQGITSHEFIIIKSYALAHTKGYQEALAYLQPYQGLLINAAKIQYHQALQMHAESLPLFDTLTIAEGTSVMEKLRENNQILAGTLKKNIQEIIEGEEKCCRFIINKKQEEIIAKINKISINYQQQKKLFQDQTISKQKMNQYCQEFIRSYKEIASTYRVKGKIKDLIDHYTLFLTSFIEETL